MSENGAMGGNLNVAEETLEFRSGRALLRGVLHLPRSNRKTPAAVICHGYFQSNRIGPLGMYVQLARELAAKGIACLRFDCTGFGESEGKYVEASYESMAHDLRVAVKVLERFAEIDTQQLALIGHSLGANIAIDISSRSRRIKGLCVLSPDPSISPSRTTFFTRANIRELKLEGRTTRKGIPVNFGVFEPIWAGKSIMAAKTILAQTLIVFGTCDPYFEQIHYTELIESFRQHPDVALIEGADHNYLPIRTRNQLYATVVTWLANVLESR